MPTHIRIRCVWKCVRIKGIHIWFHGGASRRVLCATTNAFSLFLSLALHTYTYINTLIHVYIFICQYMHTHEYVCPCTCICTQIWPHNSKLQRLEQTNNFRDFFFCASQMNWSCTRVMNDNFRHVLVTSNFNWKFGQILSCIARYRGSVPLWVDFGSK